jgi:hypothetical protein
VTVLSFVASGPLELPAARADEGTMAAAFGIVSLLLIVVVIGWMLTSQQSARAGAAEAGGRPGPGRRERRGVRAGRGPARVAARAERHVRGTSLAGFGVTLARADASTYCIQNARRTSPARRHRRGRSLLGRLAVRIVASFAASMFPPETMHTTVSSQP